MTKSFTPRTPRSRTPAGETTLGKKRGRNAAKSLAGGALTMKYSASLNPLRTERVAKVLARAAADGLLTSKETRVAGRVSPELVDRAKQQTGITSDTELVTFALANVALEDNFAEVFRKLKGRVNPALDLGY